MKAMQNIEKSKFKPNTYVGYGKGGVFLIRKNGKEWRAECPALRVGLQAKYLHQISDMLATL
jgi:hypothetical protein